MRNFIEIEIIFQKKAQKSFSLKCIGVNKVLEVLEILNQTYIK